MKEEKAKTIVKAPKLEPNKFYVDIPEDLVGKLQIKDGESADFTLKETELVLKLDKHKESNVVDLKWLLLPSGISAVIFLVILMIRNVTQVPLTGDWSISLATNIFGLIGGMAVFIYFYLKDRKEKEGSGNHDIYWRHFPVVVISFAIMSFLILLVFFSVLNKLFYGITFDIYTSSVLLFMFVSIINYVMIYMARSITPKVLTNLLIFVIIGGVFWAMITNSDQQWWQYNFSFLGTSESAAAMTFNLTLIISGLLMVALIDYLFVLLRRNLGDTWRLRILSILLILTAICLAAVGFFPYKEGNEFYMSMHNRVAGYLVYLIIALIVGLRWLLPQVSKDFLKISYIIAGGLLVTVWLFLGIWYLSLTAFELIAFILAFSWLLMLLSNLQKLAYEDGNSHNVEIKKH